MEIKKPVLLSTLWLFLVVNFIFCDVFTLHYAEDLKAILAGEVDGTVITQGFLLAFAVVMELAMVMILLSRILPYKSNRWLNIALSILLLVVQVWSLSVGESTLHYYFFSVVEVAACVAIAVVAWKWKKE